MKDFRTFITEEVNKVEQYLQEFEDAVSSTHRRADINGHTFFVPLNFKDELPNKMIASAFQGDEPAGWVGLLEFVKNNKPQNANVTYLPVFSKETFQSGKHEDPRGENPNHNIPNKPSKETSRLLAAEDKWLPLASGGFLDLQEDPYRGEGYAFVWSDRGDLGSRIVDLISEYFDLFGDGRIDSDDQGMFGDYLATKGITPSVTSETPIVGEDMDKRVKVNVEIIKEFLK
jgi:hypothetical protein|tara:strand:+ start:751 stop:1440 length:690 start_codon:yes stop_codon:yes gene_type:complete